VIYGDNRLGTGVTVLPGTVLSMNVPDNAVVGGNPGSIVRVDFDNSELRRTLACDIDRESLGA
jgi:acetyltransferase-like isoleucine patch superfamily enzyme